MLENVIRHMEQYGMMQKAGLPLNLIESEGEDACAKAAELAVSCMEKGYLAYLPQEAVVSLIRDSGMIRYLGRMRKAGKQPQQVRLCIVLRETGTERLSGYPYAAVEELLGDEDFPAGAVYPYLKYFWAYHLEDSQKAQAAQGLLCYYGTMELENAGQDIRMLLAEPAFSGSLPVHAVGQKELLGLFLDPAFMGLANWLHDNSGKETSLLPEQMRRMAEHPQEILQGLKSVKELLSPGHFMIFLQLWLWSGASWKELRKVLEILPGASKEEVIQLLADKGGYVNALYGNPLKNIDFRLVSRGKSELILYAVTNRKKHFMKLLDEHPEDFLRLPDTSILLDPDVYRTMLNVNTLNEQNLKDCFSLRSFPKQNKEILGGGTFTFEELAILSGLEGRYLAVYRNLDCERSDERLRIMRELKKRRCLPFSLKEEQLAELARRLSEKLLSQWMKEDFGHIAGLKYDTAVRLLACGENLAPFFPEIENEQQARFLLRDREKLAECGSLAEFREQLLEKDDAWKKLCGMLKYPEDFIQQNKERIRSFVFEGGAEMLSVYLSHCPEKREEIRCLLTAELMGKFRELKYHGDDLEREIAYPVSERTKRAWMDNLERVSGKWRVWEEDRFLPVMQVGEVPTRTCLSYQDGACSACLPSCFDSNKKILFLEKDGETVFRAILRLTKGSFQGVGAKKIEFVDMLRTEPEAAGKKEEGLVLFLERAYHSGISQAELQEAAALAANLVREKAGKLGAKPVISRDYQNCLPREDYVVSDYYLYISASKNGSQYLDSLGGSAGVSNSGSYRKNSFLLEA